VYRAYEEEFEKIIESFPNDEEFTVLFTGGLDSTIILDAAIKLGKKVRAVTAVQEVLKKDDEFAIEYCRKLGIPHDVIKLPTENPFESYSAAIRDMEDADSVLAGLSITLRAISKEAKAKGLDALVTGSYIEPIL
ncbi:MAG: asparagine synthase-related protein, partial [Patescibacteria group bacterium]